ncbi:MAG: EAL domain-containing protein [Actinomycetota bacterium]|nr:EAL domain-containing protein [Actinomycetota bacterium]
MGPPGVAGGAVATVAGPERYGAVLDHLREVVFETDARGFWTYLNQAWAALTGHAVADSLGRHFLEFMHPEERAPTIALFEQVVSGAKDHCHHQTRLRAADGSERWVELRSAVLFGPDGGIVGHAGTILDISDRHRAHQLLAEQARILEMMASGEPVDETMGALAGLLARRCGLVVSVVTLPPPPRPGRPERTPGAANGGLTALARPDGEVVIRPSTFTPGPLAARRPRGMTEVAVHSPTSGARLAVFRVHHRDGDTADFSGPEAALVERCVHLAAIAIERRRAEDEARRLALHDPLTGLPNRTVLVDRVRQALSRACRRRQRVALLLFDLDHFKIINDTLGHQAGDRVLRQVAERLDDTLDGSDTLSRIGGDQFVVVLSDPDAAESAQSAADEARRALSESLRVDDVDLQLEASVGIAAAGAGAADADDLLRQADVAMRRAKRLGTGQALYDPRSDDQRLRRSNLAVELRRAIASDELLVHYQPKVELTAGRVVGVEGLVRWRHPRRGIVMPDEFISVAEASGAIKPLSLWVLQTALADMRICRDEGMGVSVAVNLSATLLHDSALPRLLEEVLEAQRAGRAELELEITESAAMADPERAMTAMSRLAADGIAFSIDDFGTGYSSLAYLKRLPARSIKIDRSFVRGMATDERDASIVRSAIELAHSLGIGAGAEGVETPQVCRLLEDLRCDYAQGFYLARPMPVGALAGWLRRRAPGGGAG